MWAPGPHTRVLIISYIYIQGNNTPPRILTMLAELRMRNEQTKITTLMLLETAVKDAIAWSSLLTLRYEGARTVSD